MSNIVTFTSIKQTKKGFTLIELLVVIAIIGILSSVLLASLSTSRQKSRDSKRVSDISQISLALELLFDVDQSYASTTPAGFFGADAAVKYLESKRFISQVSLPPPGSASTYVYYGVLADGSECTGTNTCSGYALGVDLERSDNIVLVSDKDQILGAVFYGTSGGACTANVAGPERCYDIASASF